MLDQLPHLAFEQLVQVLDPGDLINMILACPRVRSKIQHYRGACSQCQEMDQLCESRTCIACKKSICLSTGCRFVVHKVDQTGVKHCPSHLFFCYECLHCSNNCHEFNPRKRKRCVDCGDIYCDQCMESSINCHGCKISRMVNTDLNSMYIPVACK